MFGINLLCGTMRLCVGDIYSSSIDQIFSATCSVGDMKVVFGCELYLFPFRRLIKLFKIHLVFISTLCSWEFLPN